MGARDRNDHDEDVCVTHRDRGVNTVKIPDTDISVVTSEEVPGLPRAVGSLERLVGGVDFPFGSETSRTIGPGTFIKTLQNPYGPYRDRPRPRLGRKTEGRSPDPRPFTDHT